MGKVTKRKRRPRQRKKQSGKSMMPWLACGALVIGGIFAYDSRGSIEKMFAPARLVPAVAITERKAPAKEPSRVIPKPDLRPVETARAAEPAFTGKWYFCASRTDNCILDGRTILYKGEKIRIADMDPPAVKEAKCDEERKRGFYAQQRLRVLLNEKSFTLASWPGEDKDREGRKLRVIMRDGRSVGEQLVREGFARPATGRHQSWCS
ncbi:thermonuclease family protein [Sinorhizobium sp. BG8]|uniref:thermonuclease family protein n=1 Tax=Sinorhizobium sp. BG8 TaxID=2613773 RepID=UPI00193DE14B|nr:thermonuclease family protein [Sinorhizobium sp. BG8]